MAWGEGGFPAGKLDMETGNTLVRRESHDGEGRSTRARASPRTQVTSEVQSREMWRQVQVRKA